MTLPGILTLALLCLCRSMVNCTTATTNNTTTDQSNPLDIPTDFATYLTDAISILSKTNTTANLTRPTTPAPSDPFTKEYNGLIVEFSDYQAPYDSFKGGVTTVLACLYQFTWLALQSRRDLFDDFHFGARSPYGCGNAGDPTPKITIRPAERQQHPPTLWIDMYRLHNILSWFIMQFSVPGWVPSFQFKAWREGERLLVEGGMVNKKGEMVKEKGDGEQGEMEGEGEKKVQNG